MISLIQIWEKLIKSDPWACHSNLNPFHSNSSHFHTLSTVEDYLSIHSRTSQVCQEQTYKYTSQRGISLHEVDVNLYFLHSPYYNRTGKSWPRIFRQARLIFWSQKNINTNRWYIRLGYEKWTVNTISMDHIPSLVHSQLPKTTLETNTELGILLRGMLTTVRWMQHGTLALVTYKTHVVGYITRVFSLHALMSVTSEKSASLGSDCVSLLKSLYNSIYSAPCTWKMSPCHPNFKYIYILFTL